MDKVRIWIVVLFVGLFLPVYVSGQQEDAHLPQRTPEYEAMRQTERMKIDLELTPEQEKLVYNINLKYERERQLSNKRSDALERIKNKNADLKKVLTDKQYNMLQRKRYDQSTFPREDSR